MNNATSPAGVGNIVAADLNGVGAPSIALTNGTGDIYVLLADPDSNQFLPLEAIAASGSGTLNGPIAVAPFTGNVATPSYRGPTSDPSKVVNNSNGTWTRTFPDGTVVQFNSSGQETSEADRNANTFAPTRPDA